MTIAELLVILEAHDPSKLVALYDKDGDSDEVTSIDSYDDAVVFVSRFTSVEGGKA